MTPDTGPWALNSRPAGRQKPSHGLAHGSGGSQAGGLRPDAGPFRLGLAPTRHSCGGHGPGGGAGEMAAFGGGLQIAHELVTKVLMALMFF